MDQGRIEAAEQALADEFTVAEQREERAFRERHPVLWWLSLLAPPGITAVVLSIVWLTAGTGTLQQLLATGLAAALFFGKFIILGGEDGAGGPEAFFSPAELAWLVFYMDVLAAAVLVPHAGVSFRLPWVGRRLRSVVAEGMEVLRARPGLRRMTFAGITAFVMFPLAATGSVGGSIFGRLLGLTRRATFAAIVLGSALGCGAMYFGAGLIHRFVDRDSPVVTLGGALVIVAVILVLGRRYRRLLRGIRGTRAPGDAQR